MDVLLGVVLTVAVVAVTLLALSIRVVKQYERGVLLRFGRLRGVREPGLRFIIPFVDELRRVSLRPARCPSSRRASSPGTT